MARLGERPDFDLNVTSLAPLMLEVGAGRVAWQERAIRLGLGAPAGRVRGVASGDVHIFRGIPYARPPVGELRWRPPLRLQVEARSSHGVGELRGTAGFGFWNDPLAMTGVRRPALPCCCAS